PGNHQFPLFPVVEPRHLFRVQIGVELFEVGVVIHQTQQAVEGFVGWQVGEILLELVAYPLGQLLLADDGHVGLFLELELPHLLGDRHQFGQLDPDLLRQLLGAGRQGGRRVGNGGGRGGSCGVGRTRCRVRCVRGRAARAIVTGSEHEQSQGDGEETGAHVCRRGDRSTRPTPQAHKAAALVSASGAGRLSTDRTYRGVDRPVYTKSGSTVRCSTMSKQLVLQRARLIPVSGIAAVREAEERATSALLAVLSIVRPLSRELLSPLGASRAERASVDAYTEVIMKLDGRRIRPDGLIRVAYGKSVWSCLVEVKTGHSTLEADQINAYW